MSYFNCETDSDWPDREKFPYNYAKSTVGSIIEKDLRSSKKPLIITGYASLEKIIDFLADCRSSWQSDPDAFDKIRILLGNEPYPVKSHDFSSSQKFSQEIEDYWMEQGISIRKCEKVIAAIELLRNDIVETRIANKKPIHAKIYKGDSAITIGSSNYSQSGLSSQIEANVRFQNTKKESARFDESCKFAEQIWKLGRFYNDELIELLTRLLSYETWQVTLARACAELLEGEWAKKYKPTNYFSDEPLLWPSQEQGIAQAIWVLENVGSVLVADATGSGKTRMGVHLIKSVIKHIWGTGRMRQGDPVLICPPKVLNSWEKEFGTCDGGNFKAYSHGSLSSAKSKKHHELIDIIRRGQVLAVDEAHNFFNDSSNRTQALFSNMADCVLLFTATPINRGVRDLLSIVELLGADNFDDELLGSLKLLWSQREKRNERMPKELSNNLRTAIQQFTVRRTKAKLNSMIDLEPERYKNKLGAICRYPEEESKDYDCGETDVDRNLAQQIRQATDRLRGLVYFKEISELPEFLRKQGCSKEKYLESRLKNAKVLAAYQVMACLRSSRAALIEHIYGTKHAQNEFDISPTTNIKAKETGQLIDKLEKISGNPPKNKLGIELPEWLSDPARYKEACEEEIKVYTDIANLCKKISDARERTKAAHLIELLKHHKLMIAFDSRLITLHHIKYLLVGEGVDAPIATGETTDCDRINKLFELGSEESQVIGLCSDAMSEGVNLQQASAVVQLTMPSVIRLAEQRIGRIARMDSPHPIIEVWWPKDSDEFALRSSENKFLARHYLVSDLLGSNISLPENLSPEEDIEPSDEAIASMAELVKNEGQKASEIWTLGDVFDPVRALVEGEQSLVPYEDYNRVRSSKVRTSLSIVHSKDQPWAFFAIAGTEWGSPRWVYLDPSERKPITDLDSISKKLKENLDAEIPAFPLEKASLWLEDFLYKLINSEKEILPKKKQRALEMMNKVLEEYKNKSVQEQDREREELVNELLSLFDEVRSRGQKPNLEVELSKRRVDLSLLAEWWLDLIQPKWLERLREGHRSEPLRLKDISQNLIHPPIPTEKLKDAQKVRKLDPFEVRIVAAIIGVY
ncbi:MAG: SNF2-related protein [Oscillatoriaceae cyanobacterium Prado104]|jgi:superfamily II DNA or RNA helicase|nr:SNF2-related protein [Oscillatoriaceae cyanobacterium Prado104]